MQPRTADTVGSDAEGRPQDVPPASRLDVAPASERHSPLQSILLHLGPGVAIGVFYLLVRGPLLRAGFPPLFALMIAVPLVYAVRRKNILVGIVAHMLVTSVDVIVGFAAIIALK